MPYTETAQIVADSGVEANCAVVARFVAGVNILHTNFDKRLFFSRIIHSSKRHGTISEEISETVVEEELQRDYDSRLEEF